MNTDEIQQAIVSENIALIQSVKGIGAKTAQRVIIDLKDKIMKTFDLEAISIISNNTNKDEALSALEVLGFHKKQAEKVLNAVLKEHADATVELLIKTALKRL
jgi:Holliday junction DNA helicase RuvA